MALSTRGENRGHPAFGLIAAVSLPVTRIPALPAETQSNLICSMSAEGSCADNAAAESFFGALKRGRIYRRQYRTRAEARTDIFDYLERFHNPRKRRQLEMRSAAGFRLNHTVRDNGVKLSQTWLGLSGSF